MDSKPRKEHGAVGPETATVQARDENRDTSRRRLIEEICRHGHEYGFFQLVRLLSHVLGPGEDVMERRSGPHLRFRPSTSVVFPATDVKAVEWSGSDRDPVTVVASFLGLYGFDSPLPSHFSRALELEQDSSRPLQTFLDVFNHRLYSFYYRAWDKYRPWLSPGRESNESARRRVFALAGLAAVSASEGPRHTLSNVGAFAGQLGGVVRNADGLRNILKAEFPSTDIRIQENVPRWVWLSERTLLGRSEYGMARALGSSVTIGEKVRDYSGKFRVVLGPLGLAEFESCLPGHRGAERIRSVVDRYVTDFLDYDVRLDLKSVEVPPMILGERRRNLGLNTWLRRPKTEHTTRIVSYGAAPAA
jgi:type VI secretion system protein ImpH